MFFKNLSCTFCFQNCYRIIVALFSINILQIGASMKLPTDSEYP